MRFEILSKLSKEQLLDAQFGIEREGLRVNGDGLLSAKPHPNIFGDKKENPYITTDFSESQLELITPIFNKVEDAVAFLDSLYNITALELDDEYIWPQSMPAITPDEKDIPLASFSQTTDQRYREYLLGKYGGKKQLISGIHINFSIGEQLLMALYNQTEKNQSLQDYTNDLYLKLTRNYLRYNWLLVYLLGATNTIHKTYEENCIATLEEISEETYSNQDAVSFRNSFCGYQNKQLIVPNYDNLASYVQSINTYIDSGVLKSIRELYAHVRLKSFGDYTEHNLLNKGIKYIEIRTIDCNPFEKSGLSTNDLHFIHLFLLYCLMKEENEYEGYVIESETNSKRVAVEGQNPNTVLRRAGEEITLQSWGMELLDEILDINNHSQLPFEQIIREKIQVMKNHELTYSYRISKLCHEQGFIPVHMKLAKQYKDAAYAERFQLKPYTDLELSTQILLAESIKRGIRFELLDRQENFIALSKNNHTEYVQQATKTSRDKYITVLMMENKSVTKQMLHKQGINVPLGEEYSDASVAKEAMRRWIYKPVVIKPKSTNFGLGISIFPEGASVEDLIKALDIAFKEDVTVLIEPFIRGKEYRFLVIGNETVAVLHRVPANVIGDGKSTIAELIKEKNEDSLRGKGYKTPLEKIEIDDNMVLFLQQYNLTIDSVLSEGQLQYLRENSNISTGGDSIDVTDEVPQVFKNLAVKSAQSVEAKICGVDMMVEDLQDENSAYAIIELNFNPAIHIHSFPYKGTERNIAAHILKLLDLCE
ncbi:bifunctional glutamate--cysteine ligase GshA/glutathione synthetase GshB [Bacillus massiliigorillae]|uniref:bifunctional glutamate--cysteine ligase GshA/glutathione synthetase GshB n=1 Tax=Bacillus massiliigorillae TaxID=1243664 RepID=UPI00039C8DF6|nr:bifunctional glutamate--cysteine ligase GshA/glutathione synthetase GshB [Bacillus massiliigorillae]